MSFCFLQEPKVDIPQVNEFLLTNPSNEEVLKFIAEKFGDQPMQAYIQKASKVMGWDADQTLRAMVLFSCLRIQTLWKQVVDLTNVQPPKYLIIKKDGFEGPMSKEEAEKALKG